MAYSSVDKLCSVAKILKDARLQELINENRKLQLALFWKTYGICQLRNRITSSIQRLVKCKCKSCNWNGKSQDFNGVWYDCGVMRRFQEMAQEHGLSVATENFDDGICGIFDEALGDDETDEEQQFFCSGDVHIVLPTSFTDWVVLGFGEKLNQAKSVEDPELIKLKALFQTLEEM